MNIFLGFCTPDESKEAIQKRLGKCNIYNSERWDDLSAVHPYLNNKNSIAKQYNKLIHIYKDTDCVLVLAHDDIIITDRNWIEKVHQALEKYDVVGLAGGSEAVIREPVLWHLMCPKETHRGDVYHVDYNNKTTFKTHFGKNGRVLLLDGLFLAFNPKKIFEAGVLFDETCPAKFHFYDLDFSLTCNKNKLKLGTTNINVVHSSPGLREFTEEFKLGQDWLIVKSRSGKY
jgi:Glycosyltransferase like family